MKKLTLFAIIFFLSYATHAGDVEVVNVEMQKTGSNWRANVTLRHDDSGWEHYADAWRVVSDDGKVYGTRTLFHPHENEQPFTRSLGNIEIPSGTTIVYVEAHDKVHGWSKQKVKVDLTKDSGDRFTVSK